MANSDEVRTPQLHSDMQRWYTSYEHALEDCLEQSQRGPAHPSSSSLNRSVQTAPVDARDDLSTLSTRLSSRNPNEICSALLGMRRQVGRHGLSVHFADEGADGRASTPSAASSRSASLGDGGRGEQEAAGCPGRVPGLAKRAGGLWHTPMPEHANAGVSASEAEAMSVLLLKARVVLSDLLIGVLLMTREKLYEHCIFWQWVESHAGVLGGTHPEFAETFRTLRRTIEVAAGIVHISTTSLAAIPPGDIPQTRSAVGNIGAMLTQLFEKLPAACDAFLVEESQSALAGGPASPQQGPLLAEVIDAAVIRQCFGLGKSEEAAPRPPPREMRSSPKIPMYSPPYSAHQTEASAHVWTPKSNGRCGPGASPAESELDRASQSSHLQHTNRSSGLGGFMPGVPLSANPSLLTSDRGASGRLRNRRGLGIPPLRASEITLDELKDELKEDVAYDDERILESMLDELRIVNSLSTKLLSRATGIYRRYVCTCAAVGLMGCAAVAVCCWWGLRTERMARFGSWLRNVRDLTKDFLASHIVEPIRDIHSELTSIAGGEKAATLHREVEESIASLRQMLQDFLATTAPLADTALAAARDGDINDPTAWQPVHALLVDQIKYPVYNATRGDLGRALLLTMMRSKLVVDQQSVEVNLLLRANRFNMNAMAMFPAMAGIYGLFMSCMRFSRRLNRRLPMNNPAVKCIFCFREIHRLFSYLETTHPPASLASPADLESYIAWLEKHGKVLAALSLLERSIASMPLRIEVRSMLAEDLEELKAMYAADDVRFTNVDRIWTMFPWIIGVDASARGKSTHQIFF
eukprot:TRINITY_DN24534_c0_g1_i1.p1 TRINITY_DN24534_c0_g1~~TRINITY_DN24534_c0_g1_i1.p1  ORF type:complete len:846 (+),score=256.11 TRINITY_DN24534_c0_g1_i1:112-2538(+)